MSRFGDTPNLSQPGLCLSCRNAVVIQGRKLGEEIILCGQHHSQQIRITFPVIKCSAYDDKALPPLWELEKIAWRFSVDNVRKTAGFTSKIRLLNPKQYRKEHGNEDE